MPKATAGPRPRSYSGATPRLSVGNSLKGAAVRADFVPFGDGAVTGPGHCVVVIEYNDLRRQQRGPTIWDRNVAVEMSMSSMCRSITASINHGVDQSRRRMLAFEGHLDYGMVRYERVPFNADCTRTSKASWVGVTETG